MQSHFSRFKILDRSEDLYFVGSWRVKWDYIYETFRHVSDEYMEYFIKFEVISASMSFMTAVILVQ